ncbi:MAG: UDP-N-acetylmuramoyl-tripeptide--D-alanyl-D-alanine ligase [Microbacteriaceae bacterium]|nr:UDP-N-acetylmuramoyl-tripeptide--D-alanyl-D-alanine ligase [Microbacteriaceae bacterium]
MIALTLAALATAVDGTLNPAQAGAEQVLVTGTVRTDSRLITPGDLFFAIPGEVTDGHLFADDAVDNGAVVIFTERKLNMATNQIIVSDAAAALSALASFVVAEVRSRGGLRVIGITGSNGKTTTKNMLRAMLATAGETVAPEGSFNNHIGAPLSMLGVTTQTRYLVIEMGASGVGEIAKLVQIAIPDVSVVLSVGLAHAGEFGGIDQTARAKSEIVIGLPESAVAVLNLDDERVAAMSELTQAAVVTFGLDAQADVRASELEATASGTVFVLQTDGTKQSVSLQILGEHHVMNALAAISVCRELGVPLDPAIQALESLTRAERWRMEVLYPGNDVMIINDAYNASPDSMAAALKTLAQLTRGERRSVAILGEMAELGEFAQDEHDRIGRLAVRLNIAQLIVVGHGARHIHNAAGLEGSWDGESRLVATAEDAFELLNGKLRAGDVVLVKSSKSANLRFLGDRLGGVSA